MSVNCFGNGVAGWLKKSKESEKADRYIKALYDARCNAQWAELPELTRKVEKHASDRQCLTLASKASHALAVNSSKDAAKAIDSEYGEGLSLAARDSALNNDDALDALVTRASILLAQAEYNGILNLLRDPLRSFVSPRSGGGSHGWASLTIMKGTLLRGLALQNTGHLEDAAKNYRSVIGYLSRVANRTDLATEVRRHAQELLVQICLFFSDDTVGGIPSLGEAMAAFHILSQLLKTQKNTFTPGLGKYTGARARQVWRAHYIALSTILKEDLVYHPSPLSRDHDSVEHRGLLDDADFDLARQQQRQDLRRVENKYEQSLLQETSFPKANETNQEVRNWVELVIGNWYILCGPRWTEEELGTGGKLGVARDVLEILYRAATKTFHSTQILRHLFSVHAYLGEFDLAYKAFDTYVEITTKGKERVSKSGDAGIDLDDDDTAFRTAAEAIGIACKHAPKKMAEKAVQIGRTVETWLESSSNKAGAETSDVEEKVDGRHKTSSEQVLSASTLRTAYTAIAISQATWSRVTPDAQTRSENQVKAASHFQKAMELGLPDEDMVDTFYGHALLLAETGDISSATELVKGALASLTGSKSQDSLEGTDDPAGDAARQLALFREALPLWHLLAQLLSAFELYETAMAACEECFEKLGEYIDLNLESRSPGDRTLNPKYSAKVLDSLEKQTLLEIKMTQLAILEITENTDFAMNASNELLGLFAKLFGSMQPQRPIPESSSPQTSRNSAIKGAFSRPTTARNSVLTGRVTSAGTSTAVTSRTSKPPTIAEHPPQIQITDGEDSIVSKPTTQPTDTDSLSAAVKNTISPKKSLSLRHRPSTKKTETENRPTSSHNEKTTIASPPANYSRPGTAIKEPEQSMFDTQSRSKRASLELKQPIPPPDMLEGPLTPHFQTLQSSRHRVSVLVGVWLFVAALYSRCSLFEDAEGAIDEAQRLVESLELEVATAESSIAAFQRDDWGGGTSVEELWANVHATHGDLLRARNLPHDAAWYYDQALLFFPDHARGILGAAGILLDMYSGAIAPEKSTPPTATTKTSAIGTTRTRSSSLTVPSALSDALPAEGGASLPKAKIPEPPELYRIAGRDRAYGLLASLSRLPAGWDDSNVWVMLARAYEESGQFDKAKDALWWVVRLESGKPVRSWRAVSPGGYVL